MNAIKQGYKQTKVGIIPVNWEVVKLGKLGDLIGGGTPSTKNEIHWIGNIPWISSSDLNENSIYDISISRFINENAIKNSATKLIPKNSILIVSRVGVGKIAINNQPLCTSQDFQSLVLKKDNHIFLAYKIKNEIQKLIACNQGTSIKGFVKEDLSNLQIPLPPLKEQEKIAEILTTWDEAITKQEELIKAKELQKKALMQKLLSGEVRFGSFNDEWEEVRLGDVCDIKKGEQLNKDTLDSNGDFPVINGGIEPSGYTEEWNMEANTITISEGGNSCGYVNFLQDRFWSGGHCYTLLNLKIDKIYLYQFLKYNQHNIMKLRVGSGLPNIQKSAIEKFLIVKPVVKEQQKIAEVLSLSDNEIDLLKNELEELKQQKKALMQKLLTGQVRVRV